MSFKHPIFCSRLRYGFTLVELIIVILILGILAGTATPKMMDVSKRATENGLKQTLAVVRDAIEIYAAQNAGQMPGADGTEATFLNDLAPFIRGQFPENPIKNKDTVDVKTGGTMIASTSGPYGWRYDNQTGQFIANSNGKSSDGVTRYREF